MQSEAISKLEYEALAEFRYTLRQFLRFSEEAAQEVGLTPQQHQALLAIEGFPDRSQITVGELAERLQIRHHSAVGLIDRLASQDLVARQPSSSDHRQVYVLVTKRGSQLLHRLSAAHREELRRIGPQFRTILERLALLGEG
ncbi:MAG TPA: MarR family transcriptional regulator [Capsulimonadaceae bacterium]|nr:MarR family transcriptional regulator [Capsulimonadaceae bacterium]